MPTQGHPNSYYVATSKDMPVPGRLQGDETTDVCVVGAGYTGLSAALHLAERGYAVTVIEAERSGWGASGRNGGQLGSGHRKDQRTLEEKIGREWAHRLWSLAEDGLATVKDLIAKHDIDCDLKPGILHAAWKRGEADWFRDEVEHMASEYGYDKLRFVPRDEIRGMVDTDRYHAGLLDMGGAHLHPLNYALGLARAAMAKGARIHENTRALEISKTDPARVRTSSGTVTARHVVIACNGYLGSLMPGMAPRIMPVNNFILATEPLGEKRARGLHIGEGGAGQADRHRRGRHE